MASILWRCPPDTRPAQRFCDYATIIPAFPEIRKSIIMGLLVIFYRSVTTGKIKVYDPYQNKIRRLPMEFEGYCVKCREKQNIKDGVVNETANGRQMAQGVCPKCGTKVTRFLPKEK